MCTFYNVTCTHPYYNNLCINYFMLQWKKKAFLPTINSGIIPPKKVAIYPLQRENNHQFWRAIMGHLIPTFFWRVNTTKIFAV